MKPIRHFAEFEGQTEQDLVTAVNRWIDETGARVVNYTMLSRDSKPKILLFYEIDNDGQD